MVTCTFGIYDQNGRKIGLLGDAGTETKLTLTDDTDLENFRVGDRVTQNKFNETVTGTVVQEPNDIVINGGVTFDKFDQNYWTFNVQNATYFTWGKDPVTATFNYHVDSIGDKIYFLRPKHIRSDGTEDLSATRIKDMYGDFVETRDEFINQSDKASEVSWTDPFGIAYEVYALTSTKTDGTISFVTQEDGGSALLYFYGVLGATNLVRPTGTVNDITGTTITLSSSMGDWSDSGTEWVLGPNTTPPTGTVASTDSGANTMVLSAVDETFPKRWIVNAGKFVIGKEYPSGDAAPDPDDVNFIGTNFVGTEATMTHASSDWQVAEFADTTYSSPTSEVTDDPAGSPPPSWTSGALEGDTKYRARVRYKSTSGVVSEWSDDRTFVTEKAGSDLAVKPGPLWATGSTAGKPGSLKTNPVKMVSVAWGELGVALGLDGKLYTGDLTYNNMKAKLTPAEPWLGMGVTYRKQGIGIIESSGNVDLFNAETGVYFAQDVEIAPDVRCNRFSFCASEALMYVEGDDGNIYVANSLSPTSFRKLIDGKNVVDFAVGRKTYNKITFIDDQGDLYQADVSDTNDPAVTVSGYNQLYVGTKFKSIVSGYMGSLAATTQDNQIKIINPTANIQPELENLPAGVDLKEIGFGFYSIWALAKDGTVFVGGNASSHAEPLEGTPSATTWAKLLMPYPCRGLGMTKYSGGGYDFAFIIDEDA